MVYMARYVFTIHWRNTGVMELEYVRISRKEEVTRSGQTTNNALWDYNRESIIKNMEEFIGDTNAIYLMATKKTVKY